MMMVAPAARAAPDPAPDEEPPAAFPREDASEEAEAPLRAAPAEEAPPPEPYSWEEKPETSWGGVPIIGGNSDYGWGGGILLSVSRSDPETHSYAWRAETAAVTMFDLQELTPLFQDYYLLVSFKDAFLKGLRIDLRPSFTRLTSMNYYGLGNASVRGVPGGPSPDGEESLFYHYGRDDATWRLSLLYDFAPPLRFLAGLSLSHNWMTVGRDSLLRRDADTGPEEVRSRLTGLDDHSVAAFHVGLELDTRDDEVNPTEGQYHTIQAFYAPGGAAGFSPTWGRLYGVLRGYLGLWEDRVVLAGRVLADVLYGEPPVYELTRIGDLYGAIGGEKGLRGPEAQRYHGKIKLIGNAEIRLRVADFELLGGKNALLLATFTDVGRVWTDFGDFDLDGEGLGLKYSVGGGARLLFDRAFVVSLDLAWSPDAVPLGVYLAAGHAF